jgi:hypothetical protein
MKKHRLPVLLTVASVIVMMLVFCIVTLASGTPSAEIKLHNLSMRQNVVIKYAVEVENLPADATVGVELLNNGVKSEAVFSEITVIDGKEYYVFDVDSISAAEMSVYIYAKPYIKKADGSVIYGAEKKNSILEYAYKALGKIEGGKPTDQKIKNLIEAMLEYGAAVQIYTDTNLDRLANAEYYQINVIGCSLSDGYASGLYQKGETVTLKAVADSGEVFSCWKNSA